MKYQDTQMVEEERDERGGEKAARDNEGPRNRDERGGEKTAGEDETGYRNMGERRREQGVNLEGPGQGDEQQVVGAREVLGV